MTPLVSIIMPSYNAEKFIDEAINSVLNQSYEYWELLITDDNSQDGTQSILENYASQDPRIKVQIQTENQGAGVARNNAISRAKGDFIAFLDSDDMWHPDKLKIQLNYMLEHKVDFTYTAYQKVTHGKLAGTVVPVESVTRSELLKSNVIGCLTAVYNAKRLGKFYMPKIRKRQDMALWLKILEKTPKAHCITQVLAFYRTDVGMSQNKVEILKWQWRLYRNEVNLGLLKSCYYFLHYAIKGFAKSRK
ncbi:MULTISPECIES: glycosyltransferase family 2 protein [Pseudoalteromonas]|uniref:Glycosyltransferase n=1 Tax=Pseudoalteromonas rubra TaxID=43658 RepID=A0A5S3V1T5_9GAMM|nr:MULTISPECIES: glycosyltransferase family 2 protein [Pseudoalteromonas]MCG7562528.1 glycosyltransferase [Pseudoalteromonas sp. McH1-42]MEC4089914.1 glycosyltransferase family 2 protein [Pseudoalteromonas rubra]QPB84654.1 glycosyltransferase [Pseudoalteromonas rubra]